jgi:hypothetical protein
MDVTGRFGDTVEVGPKFGSNGRRGCLSVQSETAFGRFSGKERSFTALKREF